MKANLENIQKIYTEIPNTWVVNGIRCDNYSMSENHFDDGWRDVVIPDKTEYQKLSYEYFYDEENEIITKEVIDFTSEEITSAKMQQAILIDSEYKRKISDLLRIPIEKVMCGEYETIPQDKLNERDLLKTECNNKILALGITDFSFRQSTPKLGKIINL